MASSNSSLIAKSCACAYIEFLGGTVVVGGQYIYNRLCYELAKRKWPFCQLIFCDYYNLNITISASGASRDLNRQTPEKEAEIPSRTPQSSSIVFSYILGSKITQTYNKYFFDGVHKRPKSTECN
jgi:hypothetical protein